MRLPFQLFLIFLLIATFTFLSSCLEWKVTILKKQFIHRIPNGKKQGEVTIKIDEFGLQRLTSSVYIYDDNIFAIDNIMKRLQVMTSDGTVELIIGNVKDLKEKSVKKSNFKFNYIGNLSVSKKGAMFVQNIVPRSTKKRLANNVKTMVLSPSYILVFDKDGQLQYTLGSSGNPDIPFYYIENLSVDDTGRLFVLTRSFDNWTIYGFKNKKRIYYINLGKLKFSEKEGKDTFTGKIENIRKYYYQDKLIISVAYYHGLRLKYRKVYDFSLKLEKITKTIVNIPDPKNVLFNIVDDKYIYFWNVDKNKLKFMICDFSGNIINNKMIQVKRKTSHYYKILSDENGTFYSYSIKNSGIDIYSWK